MAGSVICLIPQINGITVSGTIMGKIVKPMTGGGAHRSATFYFDCSAINSGDTWTVAANWMPTTTDVQVGITGNVTAAGLYEIVLSAPFSSANRAVPNPTSLVFTNTVDGGAQSISGSVWAVYGD